MKSIIAQVIMTLVSINMVLNVEHRYDFGKIRVGLMKQILMIGFSGISDTGWVEDRKMIKDKLTDEKKIVSMFKSKLVKMIKNAGSKYDDYSILPK